MRGYRLFFYLRTLPSLPRERAFRHMLSCCHAVILSFRHIRRLSFTIKCSLDLFLATRSPTYLPTSSAEWMPPCVFQASVDRREGGGSLGRVENANHRED